MNDKTILELEREKKLTKKPISRIIEHHYWKSKNHATKNTTIDG